MQASSILTKAVPVEPSDKESFKFASECLYIGSGGDVALRMFGDKNGKPVVFKNVPDGTMLKLMVIQVLKTGTTAKDILALDG